LNLAIFGGLNRRPFPPGWTKETVITVFGGGELDLSSSPPGAGARLRVVTIFGGVKVLLAPGTRISTSGFGLFGGRGVKVSQHGEGPEIKLGLWVFFGGIEVRDSVQAQDT
jgi:hypothetical protein